MRHQHCGDRWFRVLKPCIYSTTDVFVLMPGGIRAAYRYKASHGAVQPPQCVLLGYLLGGMSCLYSTISSGTWSFCTSPCPGVQMKRACCCLNYTVSGETGPASQPSSEASGAAATIARVHHAICVCACLVALKRARSSAPLHGVTRQAWSMQCS